MLIQYINLQLYGKKKLCQINASDSIEVFILHIVKRKKQARGILLNTNCKLIAIFSITIIL